nr:ATP-binding cassette domain-containing protein [Streptomyces sp. SID8381]
MLRVIQAFGLTSDSRKDLPSAVDDVSFEVPPGRVTALLGAAGAGKTTTLRLMLELQQGRGITYFRGRPLHRIPRPAREVGALLGDVPGHPSRTVRGHLRMLCAAAGLPARRADEVLEAVGLVSFREERLGTLSRGMDRRLGLACVLLPEPHTLVLDNPADGLSAREGRWLHGMLRAHADRGGTVLFTTADPKEAARTADRVLTLERGVLVADQEATDFARHRLRPRVAVRSPHAARLADLLAKEARTGRRSVEVVREDGNRLSVYGSTCADVGEVAFRHGILVHQLADEVGDMGPGAGAAPRAADPRAGQQGRAVAALSAVDKRQSSVNAPSAARREPAVARGSQDSRSTDRPGPSGGTFFDQERTTDDDGPPEAAAHAAPPGGAPGAVNSGQASRAAEAAPARTSGTAKTVPARTGSAEAVAVAQRPDGASATARTDSGTAPVGRDDHRLPEGADGGSGAARARTEHRALVIASENPPPAALTQPDTHSASPHQDRPSVSRSPGGTLTSDRPDAARLSGRHSETSEAAPGRAPDDPRPASGQPASAQHADPGRADPRHADAEHGDFRRADLRHGAARSATARPAAGQPTTPPPAGAHASIPTPRPAEAVRLDPSSPLPPPISVRLGPGPLRPLRYELRRACGIGTGFVTSAAVLAVSALTALVMGAMGHSPQPRLLAAWPQQLPLPPAALGAGLLGALAFGDEFRHPALAVDRGTVPRRIGLLAAKLLVAAATALALAFLTIGCDAEVLYLVYGRELTQVPGDWLSLGAAWFGLVVGCAWAGLLAAGLFRSTTAGLAAVLAVPVVVAPLAQAAMGGADWDADGLPARLRGAFLLEWPFGGDRYLAAAARMIAQPLAGSLVLSLVTLGCGYMLTALRSRCR